MFGKNPISGRKEFKDAGNQLLVTSIFLTLQGEGPFQGRPAMFIRLAKCNLACSFCDTYFDHGDWFRTSDLAQEVYTRVKIWSEGILSFRDIGVVITGGEPSLQTEVGAFLARPDIAAFAFRQIESNGILPLELSQGVTLVVSPKCSEKDGRPTSYLKPRDIVLDRADCLKFVMSAADWGPYRTVPEWALQWHKFTGKPIYVSPMNIYKREPKALLAAEERHVGLVERSENERISFWEEGLLDMEQNRRNHEYVALYALEHGLFLTLQQHLYASLA